MICVRGERYGWYLDVHIDGVRVGTVWARENWREPLPFDGKAAQSSSHVVEWVVDRDLGFDGDGPADLDHQLGSTTLGTLLAGFVEALMQSRVLPPDVRGRPMVKVSCRNHQWQMMETRYGP